MRVKTSYTHFLYYTILLLLPVQLNYYFWPTWSIILGRKIDYLSPVLYGTDILIVLFILLWMLRNISTTRMTKRSLIIGLVVCVCAVINIINSTHPLLSLWGWVSLFKFFLFIIAAYSLNVSVVKSALMLAVGGGLTCVIGLLQVFHQGSLGGIFYYVGERSFTIQSINIAKTIITFPFIPKGITILRPYATFPHPNVFAGFIVLISLLFVHHKNELISFVLKRLNASKNKRIPLHIVQCTYWVFMSLLGITLLLTSSETAIIGFLLGLCWLSSFRLRYKAILTITIFFIVLFVTWQSFIQFPFIEAIDERKLLNYASLSIFLSSPLTGVGLKHFLVILPEFSLSRTIFFLQPVHNIYMLLLSETGVLSIIVFFAAFILLIRSLTFKLNPKTLYILIPFLFIGLNDHYLLTLHQGVFVFALSILFFLLYQKKQAF
jgi:hypothetical protein